MSSLASWGAMKCATDNISIPYANILTSQDILTSAGALMLPIGSELISTLPGPYVSAFHGRTLAWQPRQSSKLLLLCLRGCSQALQQCLLIRLSFHIHEVAFLCGREQASNRIHRPISLLWEISGS